MSQRRGPVDRENTAERPTNILGAWKNMILNLRKYWLGFGISILFAAISNIFTVIGPSQISRMTDTILRGLTSSIDMGAIQSIAWTLVILYGIGAILNYIKGWILVTITQEIARELRSEISNKINQLPMAYYSKTTVGDTLSRVTNDIDTIAQSLNRSVDTLISSATLLIGSLVMMLLTNGVMTLVAIGSSLIGFILMALIMKNSQQYFVRQQSDLGDINGQIEEVYSGHPVVKAYNGEEGARTNFNAKNASLQDSGFKAQALSSLMMPIMTFIGNFGYVAVSVVGAYLTINGTISFGVVVAFTMYVRYFTQPLAQIAQAFQTLQSAAAAGNRVFEFLDEEEMENEDYKMDKMLEAKGHVVFSNVSFSYDNSNQKIIENFSAEAKPGQKIALVGHTGAGKTTIVNLLMRFFEIDSGEIYIDDIPISILTRQNVRDQFTMVLQDTWIFEGTVRENLLYNKANVSEEKMIEATEAVGIDHFIHTLPQGYDTVLDDQANLSQGQKQQLTIARALIKDNPILILDEATSSVDTRTETLIQDAMDKLMEGRTSFIIAHRLSTIRDADIILVMENGEIIEQGNHDELMAQDGYYKDLYNSQFDKAS